jgi:dihydroflavonol-4-reductase
MARALRARGYDVRALVRDAARGRELEAGGIELVEGDLTNRASLVRAVAGITTVYNIAALYRQAGIPRAEYQAVNADAVGTLVEVAAAAGVRRVVHCSTVGVHGDIKQPPANEDAPLRPADVYQRTKVRGEQLAREAAVRSGIELTIVRPSGIHGPGDRRLLKLFRGIARKRFLMLGSGRNFYHMTYIDDVVEGFRLAGETPAAAGRTYIIAGAEVKPLKEVVALIAREAGVPPPRVRLPAWPVWIAGALNEAIAAPFGVEPPLYRRRVDFFTKSRAFDIARARAELGFAPKFGLAGPQGGIHRTLAWYREHGWL